MTAVSWLNETVPHYRELAAEAHEAANAALQPDHRDYYLKIAKQWTELVLELEQSCGPHEIT
jgi:hypothetical protein